MNAEGGMTNAESGLGDAARCQCGGSPQMWRCPDGFYVLCRLRCNRPGSGVYRNPEEAKRAWNKLNLEGGKA